MKTITLPRVPAIEWSKLLRDLQNWRDRQLARAVYWLLSKRPVQEAVVAQFAAGTPMCALLQRAVADGVEHALANESFVSENDVERVVSDELERFEIDAEKISGLERAIENGVEEYLDENREDFTKAASEAAIEELVERLRG